MKATSIEHIREHLAKGGRVIDAWGDEVDIVGHRMVYLKYERSVYKISDLTPDILAKWQLLPLEEKEPVPCPGCGRHEPYCDCPPGMYDKKEPEPVDHGTQKGQEERDWSGVYPKDCYAFRDSQKERMQRIRTRLLHGQWPEMQDLMDWWEATTGERIEWGRRCVICDGQGRLKSNSGDKRPGYEYTGCPGCSNGYSVRPTWMGDGR